MHFQPIDNTGNEGYLSHAAVDQPHIHHEAPNNTFDDVFGDDGGDDEILSGNQHANHPSDMRRLESEHTTAGYREGLAIGKQQWLQAGFDEGYGMGAAVAVRAGQLLGLLEGIAEAIEGEDSRMEALLNEAKTELAIDKMLSGAYWTGEGLWKYEIDEGLGQHAKNATGGERHPLVQKWTAIVEAEMERYGIDRGILDHVNAEAQAPMTSDEPKAVGELPKKDLLDW